MTKPHEPSPSLPHEVNGSAEIDQLANQVRMLQAECDRLRLALAAAESDRDRYLKEIYAQARAACEFEDVHIESLQANSAGVVEMIQ